ncbi:MAG: flagellar motor switch protein FliN [Proteobacteria bacterium]|nr:flagellar motor switch protein FliN [Pseudomonadota bacterium]
MADSGELDFSSLDGMDDIDWSDVEGELQQNREMLIKEAEESKPAEAAVAVQETVKEELPEDVDIDFLLNVPLRMTVEVGRTSLLIKDLLNVDLGSIIELKKKVGSPLHVLINDKLVAKGEIVVQNEKFGIKLTEIIEESERLLKLQEN